MGAGEDAIVQALQLAAQCISAARSKRFPCVCSVQGVDGVAGKTLPDSKSISWLAQIIISFENLTFHLITSSISQVCPAIGSKIP